MLQMRDRGEPTMTTTFESSAVSPRHARVYASHVFAATYAGKVFLSDLSPVYLYLPLMVMFYL